MKDEAYAIHNKAKISARKARLTMELVAGKGVSEALGILKNLNTKASRLIEKVVNSAVANAVNNLGLNSDKLYISEGFVNEGPTMKRMRAGAQGQGKRILKRSSHITIKVKEKKA